MGWHKCGSGCALDAVGGMDDERSGTSEGAEAGVFAVLAIVMAGPAIALLPAAIADVIVPNGPYMIAPEGPAVSSGRAVLVLIALLALLVGGLATGVEAASLGVSIARRKLSERGSRR